MEKQNISGSRGGGDPKTSRHTRIYGHLSTCTMDDPRVISPSIYALAQRDFS